MTDQEWAKVEKMLQDYVEGIRQELRKRWEQWALDLTKKEVHEVIGALLARQVSLASRLAISPAIWNGHVATLILRSMTDAYITLAWIFKDPLTRSSQFIQYGLGQEKLSLEHKKKQLEAEGKKPNDAHLVKAIEAWINKQQLMDFTEVNVGSWTGIDTRTMADQADCLDLYNFAYVPFSSSTHNMWQHIAKYNLEECPNPLHRYHMVPIDRSISPDIDFVYRAAKYVEKSFKLFDEKTGVNLDEKSAFVTFVENLRAFEQQQTEGQEHRNNKDSLID